MTCDPRKTADAIKLLHEQGKSAEEMADYVRNVIEECSLLATGKKPRKLNKYNIFMSGCMKEQKRPMSECAAEWSTTHPK